MTRTGIDAEIRIHSAVPTFPVSDVGATAYWYSECLGFRTAGTAPKIEPFSYASLQRDGAELMLLRHAEPENPSRPRPEGLWDAYFRIQGVHAFYRSLEGQWFIRRPLKKQRYGDWEFEVLDPNGYVLVFGGDESLAATTL